MNEAQAQAKIQVVLKKMTAQEVDRWVDGQGEFDQIARAVMAWYRLLHLSNILVKNPQTQEILASSLLVLGTLVKYAYALGIRRGQRETKRGGK